jgi:hypothetical protein
MVLRSMQGQGGGNIPLADGRIVSISRGQLEHITRVAPPEIKTILYRSIAGRTVSKQDQDRQAAYFQAAAEALLKASQL